MVSVQFIYVFVVRKMNDLFLIYLKTNVVSYKDDFIENSTILESVLISVKLDTQVWPKRIESFFLNNLLDG